jgi:hydrogenase nickel incorporation protein HypA/HybF
MHELSIANEIVSVVTGELAGHDNCTVKRVKLLVGTHSGVEADTLAFCFPLAAEDSAIAGAELEIENSPLTIRCAACNGRFVTETLHCPECGPGDVEIVGGRELEIISIDIETGEA